MKRLDIKEVGAGEVVARPVATTSGVILVQPGTVLTTDVVSRLQVLGVESVWLRGASPNERPLEEVLAELDRRFAGHDEDELMAGLKAVVAKRIVKGAN